MKNGIFKYIFILVVIAIVIYICYLIFVTKTDEANIITSTNSVEEKTETKPEDFQTLSVGIASYDNINPLLTNNKQILDVDRLVFESLVTLDENYKPQMCLASSIKAAPNEINTYIVTLAENRMWSNGNPIVADDIKYTVDVLKSINTFYSPLVANIESVDVVNNTTAKIRTNTNIRFFEYNLIFPLVSSAYYAGQDFVTSPNMPMGSGMYKLTNIDTNIITFSLNTDWWNYSNYKHNRIGTIQVKIYPSAGELYNSFKLGNCNMFTTSNMDVENYIGTIGYNKTTFKGRNYTYLSFNCEDKVLSEKEVRKAIATAIDKDNIVNSIFANKRVTSDFPLDFGNYLYVDNGRGTKFDRETAKNILTEGGWTNQNNIWTKGRNKRLSLTLTLDGEDSSRVAVAENIKGQLESIGIDVALKGLGHDSYVNAVLNKDYQCVLTGIYNSYTPNLDTFFANGNLENYSNEELTKLLDQMYLETNEEKLKELYNKLQEFYQNDQPFVGLIRDINYVISIQKINGDIIGNNYFSFYNIANWSMK